MTIRITAPGTFESEDDPVVGRLYQLDDLSTGTGAQNRLAHSLMQEYFSTGLHSYNVKTFSEFRDYIKRDLGAGFESFVYASPEGVKKVKNREEIPDEYNNSRFAMGRLLSWSDYSLKQRREMIDRLISEMRQAGVNTKKFDEIMQGIKLVY